MKAFLRHFRFSMFLVALLCIALGTALLLWPQASQRFFCYAFGAVLVLSGVIEITVYLAGARKGLLQKLVFVGGVVAAVAGVWILLAPDKVLTLTVVVMGVVLLYHGVMDVKYAFDMKRCASRRWGVAAVCGLLTCGVGVVLLVNPFESAQALFFVVAAGFIFDGVSDLFTVFAVARGEQLFELAAARATAIEGSGSIVPDPPAADNKAGEDNHL